jgi:hypothetical protein
MKKKKKKKKWESYREVLYRAGFMQDYKDFRPTFSSDRWLVICGLSMGFCQVSSDRMSAHGGFCLVLSRSIIYLRLIVKFLLLIKIMLVSC